MTRRFFSLLVPAIAMLLVMRGSLCAEPTNTAPDFKEVYDLIRTNLAGATDETLNRTAVEGLLTQLHGKVSLVGAVNGTTILQGGTALSKSTILESNVVYLRAGHVAGNLANELSIAYRALAVSNEVVGVVLDLRFASGDDYAVAVAAADLFVSKKTPVLDWGNGVVESNPGKEPIAGPLVVLVNGGTSGAAETLAAVLRESGAALIIGGPTAGEAKMFKEFPLKNGERLRIATTPVRLGDGSTISRLQPDITVTIGPGDEGAFFADAYAPLSKPAADNNLNTTTNSLLPFIDRISEADLVRQQQQNMKRIDLINLPPPLGPARSPIHKNSDDSNNDDGSVPARAAEPQKPVIRDPALARALDLIKGLAVTRESHL
ncbi:MAG: S41 family peptidase [Verrucomicrobiota bacterium]|jgi:hypothetical protein